MCLKGHIPWNKGKTGIYSVEYRKKISSTLKAKGIVPPSRTGKEPWNKGKEGIHLSPSSEFKKGFTPWIKGRCHSEMTRKKMSDIKKLSAPRGENHYLWISDRTKLANQEDRRNQRYAEWRLDILQRDNRKCRIANKDCFGELEVHHILNWAEYPELRYQINNGLTLCHRHHPRGRAKEKRLSPYFQELVSVSKVLICQKR